MVSRLWATLLICLITDRFQAVSITCIFLHFCWDIFNITVFLPYICSDMFILWLLDTSVFWQLASAKCNIKHLAEFVSPI